MAAEKKLMSARASVRTALQSAATTPFPKANNPDAVKFGTRKQKKPKNRASLSMALTGDF